MIVWGRDQPTRRPARPTSHAVENVLRTGVLGNAFAYGRKARALPCMVPPAEVWAHCGVVSMRRAGASCGAFFTYLFLLSSSGRRVRSSLRMSVPVSCDRTCVQDTCSICAFWLHSQADAAKADTDQYHGDKATTSEQGRMIS